MFTIRFWIRIVLVCLISIMLISACGTHPDPIDRHLVKTEFNDYAAALLGWESWEALELANQGGMVITISTGDLPSDVLIAVPNIFFAGSFGDKLLDQAIANNTAMIGDGEIYAARLQTSLYAIQEAIRGAPLSQRFLDPTERYLAALLPRGELWYFGLVDLKTKSMFMICQQLQNCGAFVNAKSASELAQAMRDNGWKMISASAIPTAIRTYFLYHMGWLQKAWFIRIQTATISPIITPIGIFLSPESILLPNGMDWENLPQQ
jgi:hypothetical protein